MTTQRRTIELSAEQWDEVESTLSTAARIARETEAYCVKLGLVADDWHRRADDLLLACVKVQAAGAAQADGGPVGTARYSIR